MKRLQTDLKNGVAMHDCESGSLKRTYAHIYIALTDGRTDRQNPNVEFLRLLKTTYKIKRIK